ncbi:response regulator transcription factor [Actinacidiphila acidipaludis]|uniref:Response regulator transcription factor n=1 Tax=Actinacidiphila acidipaludis TaxID=2873382 RepID=A0ABS7Q3V9_9ACTN|nr:response regulator transcription factor [Streptomyces acidipaludis]MBY8877531.1 response regulator transcription factor [Streptomyces acidipaludis]
MSRVLLIEDDPAVRRGVEWALRHRGHDVAAAPTGEEGLTLLRSHRPDVVVLDLMLPGIPGLDVCRRIREHDQVPIIIVTARGDDIDVVVGLEAGADDYVVKPVRASVLEARMRAVLRRTAPDTEGRTRPRPRTYGDLAIDRAALVVTHRGEPVPLAPSELRLLLALSDAPGQVLSRQQLLEQVWEHSYHGDVRLVDACVKRLRGKLGGDSGHIETVRGFGYRFRAA